jgi:oligopeptide/dipeptide ABC transporter ATP-binding protein
LTIVLISHDLAVVGRICDRIIVMYAGQVVESGVPEAVLTSPRHPYTQALLDAVPRGLHRQERRRSVLPVEAGETTGGCRFRPRCMHSMPACAEQVPALQTVEPNHKAACLLVASPPHDG